MSCKSNDIVDMLNAKKRKNAPIPSSTNAKKSTNADKTVQQSKIAYVNPDNIEIEEHRMNLPQKSKSEFSDVYKKLSPKEFEILKSAKTIKGFTSGYIKAFGKDKRAVSDLTDMWDHREEIITYESNKIINQIHKKQFVEPMKPKQRESMIDEDRIIVELKNELLVLTKRFDDFLKSKEQPHSAN